MKRKRKEHRSLDSILFEDDDGELEYFDVLNLLPLSNVRLEYDESDTKSDNFSRRKEQLYGSRAFKILEYHESRKVGGNSPTKSNITDEEKCKEHTKEDNPTRTKEDLEKELCEDHYSRQTDSSQQDSVESGHNRESQRSFEIQENSLPINSADKFADVQVSDQYRIDVAHVIPLKEDHNNNENQDEMSRRPQVLKVIDNDVTKRRHRRSVMLIDAIVEDVPKDKKPQEITKAINEYVDTTVIKSSNNIEEMDKVEKNAEVSMWKTVKYS